MYIYIYLYVERQNYREKRHTQRFFTCCFISQMITMPRDQPDQNQGTEVLFKCPMCISGSQVLAPSLSQFSDTAYVHTIAQPSPLSISRSLLPSQGGAPYSRSVKFPLLLSLSPWKPAFFHICKFDHSVSYNTCSFVTDVFHPAFFSKVQPCCSTYQKSLPL